MLERAAWGNGLASELGRATRNHAFTALRADHLISIIDPENRRSIRVAEAIGATLEREAELGGLPCAIYGQRRS